MANVADIAQYINSQFWELSKVKLQKLLYFAQAWSLGKNDQELFPDDFVAWKLGPAIKELHESMRDCEKVVPLDVPGADVDRLTNGDMQYIDSILAFYGDMTKEELIELAHQDIVWKKARRDAIIPKEEIKALYRGRECPLQ